MRRRSCCVVVCTTMLLVGGGSAVVAAAQPTESVHRAAPTATCSTPLKLHDGTNQSGASVSISQRSIWIDLSGLGFDNRTSSFTVGACQVDMSSAAGGRGALYATCLNPGCAENTMDPGWDNVISSVLLH